MIRSGFVKLTSLFVICAAVNMVVHPLAWSQLPADSFGVRRIEIDPEKASSLVREKTPIRYPESAQNAGIEGTVKLQLVTTIFGDVESVTVISGDPVLAQAAVQAVRQWKYKPYLSDGSPAEMETQVSIKFHLRASAPPAPPPLGLFRDHVYSNDYFGLSYPLSRDWVIETHLMRDRVAAEADSQDTYVIMAAVYIPPEQSTVAADSSFTVLAIDGTGKPASEECTAYLKLTADDLWARKEGQQKGDVTKFTIAGHDFYRADFEYRPSIDPAEVAKYALLGSIHRTDLERRPGIDKGALVCTSSKGYILLWNIAGVSKTAVAMAVATLDNLASPKSTLSQPAAMSDPSEKQPAKPHVEEKASMGRLVRRVPPVYPEDARHFHIQGSVRLSAIIDKNGVVTDLEALDGPIELVVSAVNAVRKWRYRPYLLGGNPVDVQTEITVNYVLTSR